MSQLSIAVTEPGSTGPWKIPSSSVGVQEYSVPERLTPIRRTTLPPAMNWLPEMVIAGRVPALAVGAPISATARITPRQVTAPRVIALRRRTNMAARYHDGGGSMGAKGNNLESFTAHD